MEKQKVFRITENRKLVKQNITVEGEAIIDRLGMKGWLRFREYIGKVTNMKKLGFLPDNSRVMVIDDRDGFPLSPYRPNVEAMKKLCKADGDNEMADRQGDYQLSILRAEEKKNFFYNTMGLAIMGVVFAFIVVVLLFVSGKMKLGAG